jgi:hypothetical protein
MHFVFSYQKFFGGISLALIFLSSPTFSEKPHSSESSSPTKAPQESKSSLLTTRKLGSPPLPSPSLSYPPPPLQPQHISMKVQLDASCSQAPFNVSPPLPLTALGVGLPVYAAGSTPVSGDGSVTIYVQPNTPVIATFDWWSLLISKSGWPFLKSFCETTCQDNDDNDNCVYHCENTGSFMPPGASNFQTLVIQSDSTPAINGATLLVKCSLNNGLGL